MGHLTVPLKSVLPFYAQAANHPLPGDLVAGDGSTITLGNHNINGGGADYVLPDLRNAFLIGADRTKPLYEGGQYIVYVVNAVAGANSYVYYQFTGLPNYTVQSGDYLTYDVYLPSGTIPAASPAAAIELDFANSPFNLRSSSVTDQNGIGNYGDIRSLATDKWYTRRIPLSDFVGNTLIRVILVNEYDGTYSGLTVRFQNIYITNSTGTKINYIAWQSGDGTPPISALYISNSAYVSAAASTLGAPAIEGKIGSHRRVLRQDHVAAHTHTGSGSSAGSHAHGTSVNAHGSHTHTCSNGGAMIVSGSTTRARAGATFYSVTCTMSVVSGGNHGHTVSPGADGTHSHNVSATTTSSGGVNATSAPIDARPRHYGLVHTVKAGTPSKRAISIPMGAVIMWYADNQNETLPVGLSYCDGSSLTSGNHSVPNAAGSLAYTLVLPELRNRFLIGADLTKTFNTAGNTNDDPAGAPGSGYATGTHSLAITVAQLPDHPHSGSTDSTGSHNHNWSIFANGDHSHGSAAGYNLTSNTGATEIQATSGLTNQEYKATSYGSLNAADAHSHTFFIDAGTSAHNHPITINSTGSGGTWDNRPPFIGIIFLMKTQAGSMLSVPLKTIIAMRATTVNETFVASGEWAACEGQTLTAGNFDMPSNGGGNYLLPDFRKFYPIGADRTKAVANTGALTDTAADAPGPKGTSGSATTTMTTTTMPAHIHAATSDTQGSHTHGGAVGTSGDGGHGHSSGCHSFFPTTNGVLQTSGSSSFTSTPYAVDSWSGTLGYQTQPGHGTSCDTQGAHTHTVTLNSSGSGNAFQQRPRSYGVVFYMKVKR